MVILIARNLLKELAVLTKCRYRAVGSANLIILQLDLRKNQNEVFLINIFAESIFTLSAKEIRICLRF